MFRTLLIAVPALALAACASAPAPAKLADAGKPAEAKKAPQCYSGDHGKFFNVEEAANISGIDVVCKPTSDGKGAQWMGVKHGK